MFRQFRCALSTVAGTAVLASVTAAQAQWFSPGAGCGCSTPRPAQAAQTVSCQSYQRVPVVQQCVQQVPVTQYQQVKEMVRRPVTEIEYVDQPVTTVRPITETRTRQVPVTTFQDVTEYQTQTKNGGYWTTNYQCNPRPSACEYDPTPTAFGALNRSFYRMRTAFTPSMVASREFVPQTCQIQVPITRRVATQTMQEQSYQVTRYEQVQSTRKVAVSRIRWEEKEVIAMKPVTVMQSIPVTRTAWTWAPAGTAMASGFAPTTIALAPTPDRIGTATRVEPATRTASKPETPTSGSGSNTNSNNNADPAHDDREELHRIESSQLPVPAPRQAAEPSEYEPRPKSLFEPVRSSRAGTAGLARVGGWRSSQSVAQTPVLLPSATSVAAND